jgi:2-polyprenyl-3-methyl-5-hydroxy-6-metoxy-1,4-benzoquinol methylase
MSTPGLFRELELINGRPAVFAHVTTAALWTDPHVSEQMLRYHLDGSVAISSGTAQFIEASTGWAVQKFNLAGGAAVLDLGCGPGLYTQRLARAGADVTGVDFSSRSIAYARDAAARDGLRVEYVTGDYLTWESDGRFALIMMIMRDYCALAPAQRLSLAVKVARLLEPGGAFLFDVDSMVALEARSESASYQPSPQGGFWSAGPYFEFHNTFVYPEDAVALEKFAIVEADRTRTIYNWVQHFSPESLAAELGHAGLEVETVLGDVAGRPYDPHSSEFAVIARRRSGR